MHLIVFSAFQFIFFCSFCCCRRHSPRRRSPSSSHRNYSPKRHHWSPPANRKTGLGKPGKNLFIAGFSYATTERDLEKKFGKFGRVKSARVVRDKRYLLSYPVSFPSVIFSTIFLPSLLLSAAQIFLFHRAVSSLDATCFSVQSKTHILFVIFSFSIYGHSAPY